MTVISCQKTSLFRGIRCCLSYRSCTMLSVRQVSTARSHRAEEKPRTDDKDTSKAEMDIAATQGRDLVDPKAASEKPRFRGPLKRIKDSHEKLVRESSGPIIVPNNLDKVALLWSGKYSTPEEIPPMITAQEQARADDKLRVVLCMWIMSAITFAFLTMIKLGQRRIQWSHDAVTKKQQEIWAERAKAGKSLQADMTK